MISVKIKINFKINRTLEIPMNYNHILQGFILNNLNDEKMKSFFHDKGYECNNRTFKNYCFSKLYGNFTLNRDKKTITFYDRMSLYIAAIDKEFLKALGNTFMFKENFFIGANNVQVEGFEVIKEDINNEIDIYTLSPITVYSTLYGENNKKTYYYNPKEHEFSELLRENLIKKYIAYYKQEPKDKTLNIEPIGKLKESILTYKGFIIKGWNGEFRLKGSKELIEVALSAGLGSKNSQGMGCIMLKNKI